MPLITNKYIFSELEKLTIENLINSDFTYHKWSGDNLESIRINLRNFYREVQRGKCPYCMKDISLSTAANAHVEHILPKSKFPQFMFEPSNLCVICAECNTAKNNGNVINEDEEDTCNGTAIRFPRVSSRFKIVNPHLDEYDEHIARLGIFYVDKTSKGHFTIGICKLNIVTHKFGHDEGVIDDFSLMGLLTKYQSGTESERREVYESIRSLIPRPL